MSLPPALCSARQLPDDLLTRHRAALWRAFAYRRDVDFARVERGLRVLCRLAVQRQDRLCV